MAAATINSTLFHPEHPLKRYHYGEGSTYSCAACELVVTGAGYSCDECDFNIHQACLIGLPGSIAVASHPGHELTLTRLGASRWCDVCEETSHAGAYMYICAACNYDVHPRCRSLAAAAAGAHGGKRHHHRRSALRITLKIGIVGLKVADFVTGGIMSPALDAMETMVDHI
ncbi:unnamed protein product [Urochloa decumbens]|uniref:Phorbol-ester/DAG-type domain-containing protein n=1 Tax=Urochloa decumbens TaxID=240449 RepID=A0ABC9ERB7_9POAL